MHTRRTTRSYPTQTTSGVEGGGIIVVAYIKRINRRHETRMK
jgi:hypothetical protein